MLRQDSFNATKLVSDQLDSQDDMWRLQLFIVENIFDFLSLQTN